MFSRIVMLCALTGSLCLSAGLPVFAGQTTHDSGRSTASLQSDMVQFSKLAHGNSFQEANAFALQLVSKYPDASVVHLGYARLLRDAGQTQGAIEEYKKANQLDPRNVECLQTLAEISIECLEMEKAQSYAREALRLDPNSEPARLLLVKGLLERNRLTEAQKQLHPLLNASEKNPAVWHLAAQVEAKRGDFSTSRSYLESAIALDSAQSDWILELCRILENGGEAKRAREYLDKLIARKPDSTEARLRLARNYEVYAHDYDSAMSCYRTVLMNDPENAQAITGIDRCSNKMNNIALRLKIELRSLFKR